MLIRHQQHQQQHPQQLPRQKLCVISGNFDVLIHGNVLNHTKDAMVSAIVMTHLTNTIALFSQPLLRFQERQHQLRQLQQHQLHRK